MLIQVALKKSLKYKITCIENDWKSFFFFFLMQKRWNRDESVKGYKLLVPLSQFII